MGETRRIRDPKRRERILDAAATLFSRHGYQSVNLNEIGAEAGIVGSGVYRHFDNKAGILIQLLDQVIDKLLADAEETIQRNGDPLSTLVELLASQVTVTIDDREIYRVYLQEAGNLPEEDGRRLRLKQREYVQLWTKALIGTRPELDYDEALVTVHATIAGTHSVLRFRPQIQGEQLHRLLVHLGCRTLGVDTPAQYEPAAQVTAATV